MFAEVLRARGVPDSALLLEDRSTNTGENIRFTRELLARRGLEVKSVTAVQKPYRRGAAGVCRHSETVAGSVGAPFLPAPGI